MGTRWGISWGLIFFLGWGSAAWGQRPEGPTQTSTAVHSAQAGEVQSGNHAFWDRENILLFSGVGLFRAVDYASTRNFQARGREETLLPDDVVNNSAGFAALEASATGASIALSYLMHRTGHHRRVSITHITVTAFGDGRNYLLKSGSHTAP